MTTADFGTCLDVWLEGFLVDRRAQNLARGTILFYQMKLTMFLAFRKELAICSMQEITPDALRHYILWLEAQGHNPGGVHGCYRALKTFLLWYEQEAEPEGWKNPIRRVKAPRLAIEPLAPVSPEDFSKLVRTCDDPLWIGRYSVPAGHRCEGKRAVCDGRRAAEACDGQYPDPARQRPKASDGLPGT